ncbi:MAG: hypothetical protein ACOVS5_10745, partial [Oligoflexus sp.]|jgi:hypothetical protein
LRQVWYLAIAWLWVFDVCNAQTGGNTPPPVVDPGLPRPPKVPSFVYLRCHSTGWKLDSKSLMLPAGLDGVYSLRLEIKEEILKKGGDTCLFTATATEGIRDENELCFGITTHSLQIADGKPGIASIDLTETKAKVFRVIYPKQGPYQAFLNLNEPPSLLIAPDNGEDPIPPLPRGVGSGNGDSIAPRTF